MYKTIVLALLEQLPELHAELRKNRTLLSTLNHFASQLKTSHEAWQDRLLPANRGRADSQVASEALEMALQEIKDSLTCAFPPNGGELLSLDGAMAFIRERMRPA